MILTCSKCGTRHPLSDDDFVFFHPRFFCLSCGERISMKIDEVLFEKLRGSNDRDRKLMNATEVPAPETIRQVRSKNESLQGTDGG